MAERKMDVGIDQPRHHPLAGGADHLDIAILKIQPLGLGANRFDAGAFDHQVIVFLRLAARSINQCAALNDKSFAVGRHGAPSQTSRFVRRNNSRRGPQRRRIRSWTRSSLMPPVQSQSATLEIACGRAIGRICSRTATALRGRAHGLAGDVEAARSSQFVWQVLFTRPLSAQRWPRHLRYWQTSFASPGRPARTCPDQISAHACPRPRDRQ